VKLQSSLWSQATCHDIGAHRLQLVSIVLRSTEARDVGSCTPRVVHDADSVFEGRHKACMARAFHAPGRTTYRSKSTTSITAHKPEPAANVVDTAAVYCKGNGWSRLPMEERTILEQRETSLPQEALQAAGRPLLQNRLCDLRCDVLLLPYAELRTPYLASQAATEWTTSILQAHAQIRHAETSRWRMLSEHRALGLPLADEFTTSVPASTLPVATARSDFQSSPPSSRSMRTSGIASSSRAPCTHAHSIKRQFAHVRPGVTD